MNSFAALRSERGEQLRQISLVTSCSGTAAPLVGLQVPCFLLVQQKKQSLRTFEHLSASKRASAPTCWCHVLEKESQTKNYKILFQAALCTKVLCSPCSSVCQARALQLKYIELLSAEPKKSAKVFTEQNNLKPAHHINHIEDLFAGHNAECTLHGKGCLSEVLSDKHKVDLYLSGPPCQPFSAQRSDRYSTRSVPVRALLAS